MSANKTDNKTDMLKHQKYDVTRMSQKVIKERWDCELNPSQAAFYKISFFVERRYLFLFFLTGGHCQMSVRCLQNLREVEKAIVHQIIYWLAPSGVRLEINVKSFWNSTFLNCELWTRSWFSPVGSEFGPKALLKLELGTGARGKWRTLMRFKAYWSNRHS